jgi:predicted HTH domain antitoxin
MRTLTITIPDELSAELEPYRESIGDLLALALREIRMGQALTLFQQGGMSLSKAARMAGVSLREMTQYAVAHGVRAVADEQTLQEELA